jgi:N-acetylmuramoyl-L-alanine amidase
MKCGLVVGHRWGDKGAENKTLGLTEFDFNYQLAAKIYDGVKAKGVEIAIIFRDGLYSQLPTKIKLFNPDFIVSMHCNAFNGKVVGCETLYYYADDVAKQMAQIIQDDICLSMPQKDRGIIPTRSEDRGGLLLRECTPSIIVEPFFIDNTKEVKYFLEHIHILEECYIESIIAMAKLIQGIEK